MIVVYYFYFSKQQNYTFSDRTFVSQVSQTGPARASGQLVVGDEILSINGTDINGLSLENVSALIRDCRTVAEFLVIHNADGKENIISITYCNWWLNRFFKDFQQIMKLLHTERVLLEENHSRSSSTDSIVNRRQFYVRYDNDIRWVIEIKFSLYILFKCKSWLWSSQRFRSIRYSRISFSCRRHLTCAQCCWR